MADNPDRANDVGGILAALNSVAERRAPLEPDEVITLPQKHAVDPYASSRDGKGRFLPGFTTNPGGRPKGLAHYAREVAGTDGRKLLDILAAIATGDFEYDQEMPGKFGEVTIVKVQPTIKDRIKAITEILNRGWGKSPEVLKVENVSRPAIDFKALPVEKQRELKRLLESARSADRDPETSDDE